MPLSGAPRSVSDATRFTATTPHASSKTATPPPRFSPPRPGAVPPASGGSGSGGPAGGSNGRPSPLLETPEQKVARLRAAHQRAKAAQVSKLDKVIDSGRRIFDSVHRVTVAGLVGFTILASVATAYTAFDMIRHNKKRAGEWVEAQKKMEADSLEAARIAYMTGKATEEQAALVEEQLQREQESGRKTSFFQNMPSVLGAPESSASSPATTSNSAQQQQPPSTKRITETVSWPGSESSSSQPSHQDADLDPTTQQQRKGLWTWLTANLKRSEQDDDNNTNDSTSSSRKRGGTGLGYESLSAEDDSAGGVRDSDIARAVEGRHQAKEQLRAKAQAAFEKEKENQRRGGPLDRVGAVEGAKGETRDGEGRVEEKKKGWGLW